MGTFTATGDPWDTAERAETRSRQRRALLLMSPRWLPRTTTEKEPDALTEYVLRARADRLMQEQAEVLASLQTEVVADALVRVLDPLREFDDAGPMAALWREAYLDGRAKRSAEPSEEQVTFARQLAALLVAADRASDDDYSDPRIRQP